MKERTVVGLVWDAYTPAVEAQITRDLIALQASGARDLLAVNNQGDQVNALLSALGVERSPLEILASLWITYRTQEDEVIAPEHATQVISRNLFVDTADPNLDPTAKSGYYLPQQGIIMPSNMNLNKPMPNHVGPTDPAIIFLWG